MLRICCFVCRGVSDPADLLVGLTGTMACRVLRPGGGAGWRYGVSGHVVLSAELAGAMARRVMWSCRWSWLALMCLKSCGSGIGTD
jgi:hypothetical protein